MQKPALLKAIPGIEKQNAINIFAAIERFTEIIRF